MSFVSLIISNRFLCFIYFLLCYTLCAFKKNLRHLKIKAETSETVEKKAVIIIPGTRVRQVLFIIEH